MYIEMLLRFHVLVAGIQQCLGGNTTHIQAGATIDCLIFLIQPFFDTGGLQPQLCTTNCGNITGGPGTNNYYFILFSHTLVSVLKISDLEQQSGRIFE